MQVKLDKVYPLDGSIDDAWQRLRDIELVAGCMPGAEITEKIDDSHYKGKVKVKVGPMNVAFAGEITIEKIDPDEHQIHLIASGQDSKGSSSATMDLTASIRAGESNPSELVGNAAVTVNGKLANFGARMMVQIADQVLKQFADNFRATVSVSSVTDTGTDDAAAVPAPAKTNEINGLQIAWQALIGFIKSFFGRTT